MPSLEEMHQSKDVSGLVAALDHPNMDVRNMAAYYLGEIAIAQRDAPLLANAIDPLILALEKDEGAHVRASAARALGKIGDSRAVNALIAALKNKHHWYGSVRDDAAAALGMIGDSRAVGPLIDALRDEESSVRKAAGQALDKIGGPKAEEALKKMQNR
jgi:HEAT repeat protein